MNCRDWAEDRKYVQKNQRKSEVLTGGESQLGAWEGEYFPLCTLGGGTSTEWKCQGRTYSTRSYFNVIIIH